jgi:apolipoprotein N-acyltransferase
LSVTTWSWQSRLWLALGLTVVSAILLALAFPPRNAWWLAWIALVPMFLGQFLVAPSSRSGRAVGALTYVVYLGILLWQALPPGLTSRAWGEFPPVLLFDSPAFFVVVVVLPVFWVLFFFLRVPNGAWLPLSHFEPLAWLIPPAIWATAEYVRYRLQLGHIWGNLFTTQHTVPPVLTVTAIGGPWLLTFIIVLVNVALAWLLGRALLATPRVPPLAAAGLLLAALALGAHYAPPRATGELAVALVQTGWDMADYFDMALIQGKRDYYGLAWDDVEQLTREQAHGAQLIVWPEATVWHDLQVDVEARQRLATLAREMNAYLVVPYFVEDFVNGHRNEAVLISPQGDFLGMYAKTYPIIFVAEQSVTGGNFTVFPTSHGVLATMMAYDSDFPDVARTLTGKGAQLIAVTSHDWLEMSPFQVSMSVLRAAENRVTVVKADWRYGSAAIAPDGTILAATPSTRPLRQVLRVQVPVPSTSGSLYTRLGDWVPMLCVLYLMGVPVFRWRRRQHVSNSSG